MNDPSYIPYEWDNFPESDQPMAWGNSNIPNSPQPNWNQFPEASQLSKAMNAMVLQNMAGRTMGS